MNMSLSRLVGCTALALTMATSAYAAGPKVNLEPYVTGVNSPLAMVQAEGDSRMFIAEQWGRVMIAQDGELNGTPFLDIRSLIIDRHPDFDERGLLGLALHPDFAENGKFYVAYSAPLVSRAILVRCFGTAIQTSCRNSRYLRMIRTWRTGSLSAFSAQPHGRSSTTTATGSALALMACFMSRWAMAATPTTGASAITLSPATART